MHIRARSRTRLLSLPLLIGVITLAMVPAIHAQGTVPVFTQGVDGHNLTFVGGDPTRSGTTTLETVLVPVTITFQAHHGTPATFDAAADVPAILASPVFGDFSFSTGTVPTQYGDALLRASFPGHPQWHTLLGQPKVRPVTVSIPAADGYVLTSKKTGGALAVLDADYVQAQVFKQLGPQPGKLVVVVTHSATFYADGDATICCTWGTHGVDPSTGDSFVLGSYLKDTPGIVQDLDIQPLSEQLAEFLYDPRHNPQHYGYNVTAPGNAVPAWMRAQADDGCGGTGIGSSYFLLEPTDTNPKNSIPSAPSAAISKGSLIYHLENVPLLSWYFGSAQSSLGGAPYSFPEAKALPHAAQPCSARHHAEATPTAQAVAVTAPNNGHKLIGYWTGHGPNHAPLPLHAVSQQWDTIIVAFASPVSHATEGTLHFAVPEGIDPGQFKADIAALHKQGKKVLISLGGGGAYFTLNDEAHIATFVDSVTSTVAEYGFDGVDIDFESPSLLIQPGDTDYTHPTSPSTVHLIEGLRQLRQHFGPDFMISLVPEGTQIPGGYVTYGGQFGSYLPLVYGLRDILSFVDVQDYNTPPLEGLDGEIYQSHSVDYHAAMTELLLRGFPAGREEEHAFPAVPAAITAVGFLTDYSTPRLVDEAMRYLITGSAPAGTSYRLRQPAGYPNLIGAMFWTIDDDLRAGLVYSNLIGPELHSFPPTKKLNTN